MATTLGVSAAAQTVSFIGQQKQYNDNAASAANSMRIANQQTNLGIQQSEAADSLKAQQSQRDMIVAQATAAASAGENGVSGSNVDELIGDYHAAEGRYMTSLATQGQWNRQQADLQKQGQVATAQRQINSVAKPDFLGAALRIAGDGLNTYTNLYGPAAQQGRATR